MTTTSRPKRRPRQPALPGMANPTIRAIEEAADTYTSLRDRRMALLKDEIMAQGHLLELMKEHKLTKYLYDGSVVEVDQQTTTKVKVKRQKDDEADGEE